MNENLAYQDPVWEELIDGKVVLMSPRPTVNHTRVAGNIYNLFSAYLKGKRCEPFPDGVELYLTKEDRFIPDGMIVCDRDKIQTDGVHGAPDLVVEVLSPSTAKHDIGHKKDVYEACGVKEYWIVSPGDKTVTQYQLRDGRFVLHEVYAVHPEVMLAKMREEERAAVITEFKCCLFDDLLIPVADIFDRVM